MRYTATIAFALATALTAVADNYFSADFSNAKLPAGVNTELTPDAVVKKGIYTTNSMPETDGRWFVNRLSTLYAALVPTNLVSASSTESVAPAVAAHTSMTLPAVTIDSPDALLRWDGRSVLSHRPETYIVEASESGKDDWAELYRCEGEKGVLTRHSVSLANYLGKEVEVRFTATTLEGFILAIDNIEVGVPTADDCKVEIMSPLCIGENDKAEVKFRLTNYGNPLSFDKLVLTCYGEDSEEMAIPLGLRAGASAEFTVEAPVVELNEKLSYSINGVSDDGTHTRLTDSWIFRSYYPRISFIDRASGTWCSNCPVMGLTVDRLKGVYGDQMIAVEAHVDDGITDNVYWAKYLNAFCRSIPMLVPNHDSEHRVTSLSSFDDWSFNLCVETITQTEGTFAIDGDKITIESKTRFATDIDNADRYRVGYLLVADLHDPLAPGLIQSNNASTYRGDIYFYMPSYILPEMMYYDNVPLNGTYAYEGVAGSLPAAITAGQTYTHSITLPIPDPKVEHTNLRPVVMIFDTANGNIIANCAFATPKESSGVDAVTAEPATRPGDDSWFTLQGIKLPAKPSAAGVYIHNSKKVIIK